MRLLLLSFFFLTLFTDVQAQLCQGPGRDPQTAQAVCGTIAFHETNVVNCTGPDIPNPTSGCGQVTSDNSRWYKFHCYQAGTLGFLITPFSPADDYDWEIMDITGHQPADVYTLELRVSLNLSGQTGPTGCTIAGISDINCGGGAPGTQYNKLMTLQAGHDYLMMVNNWSASNLGYDIDFTGTATLSDNLPPTVTNAAIVGCDASKIRVNFSEDILCGSITNPITLGSEFTITGGPNTITGITSACTLGANGVPYVILDLQAPLAAGNYQLNINVGGDGNTLENVCRIAMLPASIPFTVPAIVPVAVNTVNYTGCAPTTLNITLTKPIWCTSLSAAPFSEFSILPGNPTIQSVQSACTASATYIDQLQIVLQNPLAPGNYQLIVNAGADGNTLIDTCNMVVAAGYNFPFTITQNNPPPVIQSVGFDECHPDKVVVNFDKPVACASITAAGTELSITPGTWPVNSITYNCTNNQYTSQIIMNLANPLTAGNYNVVVGTGTDGNTLSDTCLSFIPAGYARPFTATQAPAPVFDSVQFDKCSAGTVKVFYSHPILCSSISANGSEFSITGPSAVTIVSATPDVTCGSLGYTRWINLQLASPITQSGNYVLHNGVGADGNGIVDTCNARQNVNETIAMNMLGKPSAVFNALVNWGCVNDDIVLSHPGGNGVNSWNWSFSDGRTASGQNVTMSFPVATPTVTVRLIVSNGSCNDTTSQTITLGNVITAAFTASTGDTICINTPVDFRDASSGTISSYLWDFGDLTQSTAQNPPTHVYASSNIYTVTLRVTDNHGCTAIASKQMHVDASARIDFTGLKPQYCTGQTVSLKRVISRNITSYVWDNGDGKTFTNEVDITFPYPNPGTYTITLSGIDKYCGPASISKTVPVYAVPKINLGPDTVLCGNDQVLIGVPAEPGYTYTWNTGDNTSQILTWAFFNTGYALTVDNHGCRARDSMHVKVLHFCLIRVPNAFTPNRDGLNDELKVLNADMAKSFEFSIYNRAGQRVFTTRNPLEGWDGRFKGNPADAGTYVWTLMYIDPWNGKTVKEKGTSILIR